MSRIQVVTIACYEEGGLSIAISRAQDQKFVTQVFTREEAVASVVIRRLKQALDATDFVLDETIIGRDGSTFWFYIPRKMVTTNAPS